jgi:hypothetical protein
MPHGAPVLALLPCQRRLCLPPMHAAAPDTMHRMQGFLPSSDQLNCVYCDATAGNDSAYFNGFYAASFWTAATVSNDTCTCTAPTNSSVMGVVPDAGRYYSRCITCPPGTTPSVSTGVCLLPSAPQPSTLHADLAYVVSALNSDQGAGINPVTATQVR